MEPYIRYEITRGYVLMTVVAIMGALSALVIGVALHMRTSRSVSSVYVDRERARSLARDGLSYMQAQLTRVPQEKKRDRESYDENQEQNKAEKSTYAELIPVLDYLNRWTTLSLTQERDGVEGEIYLYLSCEDGKYNINELYDFSKKTLREEFKKVLKAFSFAKSSQDDENTPSFVQALGQALRDRGEKLDDLSQLLEHKSLAALGATFFPHPSFTPAEKGASTVVSDILTVHGRKDIQPHLMTRSIQSAIGARNFAEARDERTKQIRKLVPKLDGITSWQSSWGSVLQPIAGIPYSEVPRQFAQTFASVRRASYVSVVSYGKINETLSGLYAILQRCEYNGTVFFAVNRLYWL